MKLSAPIHILKQQAKAMSRRDKVRLHVALDRIAVREGFHAWSHLAADWQPPDTGGVVYEHLRPGDLVLVGARPGQGKTLFCMDLAIQAMTRGRRAAFFTLEYTEAQVRALFDVLGAHMDAFPGRFLLDTSDELSASHVAERLSTSPPGTLVVIDYLQLLDQRRDKPPLGEQVHALKAFAMARRATVVCISQIRRDYEDAAKPCPDLQDVRLPNPVDLSLFDKACMLQGGKMQLLLGS